MANPESRADVRLEALSLARLRYSFLQDSACRECSFRLMLRLESKSFSFVIISDQDANRRSTSQQSAIKENPHQLTELRKRFFFSPTSERRVLQAAPYITHKSARRKRNIRYLRLQI